MCPKSKNPGWVVKELLAAFEIVSKYILNCTSPRYSPTTLEQQVYLGR